MAGRRCATGGYVAAVVAVAQVWLAASSQMGYMPHYFYYDPGTGYFNTGSSIIGVYGTAMQTTGVATDARRVMQMFMDFSSLQYEVGSQGSVNVFWTLMIKDANTLAEIATAVNQMTNATIIDNSVKIQTNPPTVTIHKHGTCLPVYPYMGPFPERAWPWTKSGDGGDAFRQRIEQSAPYTPFGATMPCARFLIAPFGEQETITAIQNIAPPPDAYAFNEILTDYPVEVLIWSASSDAIYDTYCPISANVQNFPVVNLPLIQKGPYCYGFYPRRRSYMKAGLEYFDAIRASSQPPAPMASLTYGLWGAGGTMAQEILEPVKAWVQAAGNSTIVTEIALADSDVLTGTDTSAIDGALANTAPDIMVIVGKTGQVELAIAKIGESSHRPTAIMAVNSKLDAGGLPALALDWGAAGIGTDYANCVLTPRLWNEQLDSRHRSMSSSWSAELSKSMFQQYGIPVTDELSTLAAGMAVFYDAYTATTNYNNYRAPEGIRSPMLATHKLTFDGGASPYILFSLCFFTVVGAMAITESQGLGLPVLPAAGNPLFCDMQLADYAAAPIEDRPMWMTQSSTKNTSQEFVALPHRFYYKPDVMYPTSHEMCGGGWFRNFSGGRRLQPDFVEKVLEIATSRSVRGAPPVLGGVPMVAMIGAVFLGRRVR